MTNFRLTEGVSVGTRTNITTIKSATCVTLCFRHRLCISVTLMTWGLVVLTFRVNWVSSKSLSDRVNSVVMAVVRQIVKFIVTVGPCLTVLDSGFVNSAFSFTLVMNVARTSRVWPMLLGASLVVTRGRVGSTVLTENVTMVNRNVSTVMNLGRVS